VKAGFVYPIVLRLEGKLCLVVGQGEEATEKASILENSGAVVRRESTFESSMLEGVFLAISASGDAVLNARLFEEAERRGIFVNCLDDPERCRFTFPSVHRQGSLVIAVSTAGTCPALAVRIRQRLAGEFGPEYGLFLDLCRQLRNRISALVPEFGRRRALWYRIVDSPALELLRMGRVQEAREALESLIDTETGPAR
jgi:siroheme synthase-like protein